MENLIGYFWSVSIRGLDLQLVLPDLLVRIGYLTNSILELIIGNIFGRFVASVMLYKQP
jgi:hypothetical protein